jgi:TRAP-type C4-dicarboxylate transport system substrate-binding protein
VSEKKEIHKPSDFKVGGSGNKMVTVEQNGGATVHQIPPEPYLNMDKGVINASFNTFAQAQIYKLYEICEHFYQQDFGSGLIIITMNWDAWNAMSPADQKIMEETWREAALGPCTKGMLESNLGGVGVVKDNGGHVYPPTPEETAEWQKSAQPVIDKWKVDAVDLGVKPDVCDKVLETWRNLRTKYNVK